jgi:hypothetical protein
MAADNRNLDYVAIFGYLAIFIFSIFKIGDTTKRPVDLAANILLLAGLGALITYHLRHLQTGKDVQDDQMQKNTRLVAHASITAFLLLTLTSMSKAVFRYYDIFALLGHVSLFVFVLLGISQMFGIAMLALYFILGAMQKVGKGGMEVLQLVGRIALMVFFVVVFVKTLV